MPERFEENHESSENINNKEEVAEVKNGALLYLKYLFGVDNLSNIELSHLNRIVQECFNEQKKQVEELNNDDLKSYDYVIDANMEAAYRWLWELYDIKPQDILFKYVIFNNTNASVLEVHDNKEFAQRRMKELQNQVEGRLTVENKIPEDFKKYLNMKRSESHLI